MSISASNDLPPSPIPIFRTVSAYREWRIKAFEDQNSVGYVATMGALHEGHLSLVRRSIAENDLTVLSIFVNPAQFAPHEDLATYPRTLPRDLELLSSLSSPTTPVVFLPTVPEMYPSGITQDRSLQKGTFVEVSGYSEEMEGRSRPGFFRGVATIVTKLFNIIQPTNTYFGQKDIQQALLLKGLTRDLLLPYPTPTGFHIIPTARDPSDNLALSSRNAYLSENERREAVVLWEALKAAEKAWEGGESKDACVSAAKRSISERVLPEGVQLKLDYIEFNDPDTFEPLLGSEMKAKAEGGKSRDTVLLSGAVWIGKTRLLDNLILGDIRTILA